MPTHSTRPNYRYYDLVMAAFVAERDKAATLLPGR